MPGEHRGRVPFQTGASGKADPRELSKRKPQKWEVSNQIHLPQQDHVEKSQRHSQNLGIQPSPILPHSCSGGLCGAISLSLILQVRGGQKSRFKWSSFNLYRGDVQGLYFVVMMRPEVHFHPFPHISEVLWFEFFASLPSSSTGHVPHPLICQDSSRAQRILLKAQVLYRVKLLRRN